MKILCTGGAGFIGSHLVDKLIEKGHEVSIIDDLSGGYSRNINTKVKYRWLSDLREISIAETAINIFKPEIIYHLAANAAESKAQFSPVDVTSRNYNTFINTLTASIKHGVRRFIYISSIAVYGALQPPFKETDRPIPEDLYGIVKYAGEESLKVMAAVHGFEYVIARPGNVYGPRQNMADPYRNVVTIFMNSLLRDQPIYIYGDGKQIRCYSYIDEVADALVAAGLNNISNMTFNIGTDQQSTVNHLFETICRIAKKDLKPIYLSERPQAIHVAVSDHELAKKHLDYKDKTSLEEGIEKTWEWAKSMGPQEPKYTEIEIPAKNLPENWKR